MLQLIVDELEARRTKLKKTTTESNHHIAEFQESNAENDNLNLEMEQEVVRLISDLSRSAVKYSNKLSFRRK